MKCTYPTARGVVHILTFRVKFFKKFVLVIKIRVINACRFFLVKITKNGHHLKLVAYQATAAS